MLHLPVEDRYGLCGRNGESIEHIIYGCRMSTCNEYIHRDNDVAGIIHQRIALNLNLLLELMPFHKWIPATVLENENYCLCWDRSILKNHTVVHNRPDIVVFDKRSQYVNVIEVRHPEL